MSDATTTLWYIGVDQSHQILFPITSIDVNKALTIENLKQMIKEKHDIRHTYINLYRSSFTVADTEKLRRDSSLSLAKGDLLIMTKKLEECGIAEGEILFVELPRALSLPLFVPR